MTIPGNVQRSSLDATGLCRLLRRLRRVILNCPWRKGYFNRVKHQHYSKCQWSDEDTFQECLRVNACWHMSYHGLALKSHLIGVFPQVNKKGDIFSWCLRWNVKNRRAEVPEMSRRNNFSHTLCQLRYLGPAVLWETPKGHLHVSLALCQHLAEDRWQISVIKNK